MKMEQLDFVKLGGGLKKETKSSLVSLEMGKSLIRLWNVATNCHIFGAVGLNLSVL